MLEVPRGAEQPTYRLVLSPAQLFNVLETQLQRSESGSQLHLIFTRNSPLYGLMYTECPAMQLLSNQGRIFFCSVKVSYELFPSQGAICRTYLQQCNTPESQLQLSHSERFLTGLLPSTVTTQHLHFLFILYVAVKSFC